VPSHCLQIIVFSKFIFNDFLQKISSKIWEGYYKKSEPNNKWLGNQYPNEELIKFVSNQRKNPYDKIRYFKDNEVRDILYNNENLLRFINNIQTKYKEVLFDDKEINSIMSSAINTNGKFKVRLLLNEYQKTKGIDESKLYFTFPEPCF